MNSKPREATRFQNCPGVLVFWAGSLSGPPPDTSVPSWMSKSRQDTDVAGSPTYVPERHGLGDPTVWPLSFPGMVFSGWMPQPTLLLPCLALQDHP